MASVPLMELIFLIVDSESVDDAGLLGASERFLLFWRGKGGGSLTNKWVSILCLFMKKRSNFDAKGRDEGICDSISAF